MFQFSGFAHLYDVVHLQCTGLPHSDICGSIRMCQSPQLIAAYHVLHRLCEPRHPPYALSYFLLIKDKARIHKATCKLLFILIASPFEAHTFSCQVKSYLAIWFLRLNLVYFTVFACVNMSKIVWTIKRSEPFHVTCVENNGFEPLTPCLQSRCSSQLS